MLNEVASSEEMPLIQLPQLSHKGTIVTINAMAHLLRRYVRHFVDGEKNKNKLSMIFGVTLPCILSIFSVILFLRIGLIVGQVYALTLII